MLPLHTMHRRPPVRTRLFILAALLTCIPLADGLSSMSFAGSGNGNGNGNMGDGNGNGNSGNNNGNGNVGNNNGNGNSGSNNGNGNVGNGQGNGFATDGNGNGSGGVTGGARAAAPDTSTSSRNGSEDQSDREGFPYDSPRLFYNFSHPRD